MVGFEAGRRLKSENRSTGLSAGRAVGACGAPGGEEGDRSAEGTNNLLEL
jgi:hypothetical protein